MFPTLRIEPKSFYVVADFSGRGTTVLFVGEEILEYDKSAVYIDGILACVILLLFVVDEAKKNYHPHHSNPYKALSLQFLYSLFARTAAILWTKTRETFQASQGI
jgi:hypothetical protein